MTKITLSNVKYSNDIPYLVAMLYENPFVVFLSSVAIFSIIIVLLGMIAVLKSRANNVLRNFMYIDRVTGYDNYTKFLEEATYKIEHNKIDNMALIYSDIQNFKYINDTYGHEYGNKLLTALNKKIDETLQKNELCAHESADHFVAMLEYVGEQSLIERLQQIELEILQEVDKLGMKHVLLLRMGIYLFDQEDSNIDVAIDSAIYAQKTIATVRHSQIAFYNKEMRDQLRWEKEIEQDMYRALKEHQFIAYLQPKVRVDTGEVIGAEALVRWQHPEKGLLSPNLFIPFFERNGFISNLDKYMLEEVCKYQNYFKAEGFTPFPISCNYSRKQMQDDESPKKYKKIIDQYQTDPTLIEIELTEEGAIQDMEKAIKHAKALKEEGFKLSIDDFGSGYSSIQLFYKLPIDVLKLDKSLIPNVKMGDVAKDIIKSIIKIARNHKIYVIW